MSPRRDAFVILAILGVGLSGCGRGTPAPAARQSGARRTPENPHDHLDWDELTQHQKEERQARGVITGLGGTFSVRTNGVDLTPVPSLVFDGRTRLTDEQLARVTQLAEFDRFDPSGDRRNDAEPSYEWTGFSRLKILGLPGAAITDKGLAHIASAKRVEYLDLRGNPITDAGLSNLLASTPALKVLRLGLVGVNRDGREVIQKSPGVTDDAFQRVDRLVFLENLELSGLAITDKALERVGRLRGLKTLNLAGTNITDSGLIHLEPMVQLPSRPEVHGGDGRGGRNDRPDRRPP